MSFDDTDNDCNDIMVLDILKPRSLTAAAPQYVDRFDNIMSHLNLLLHSY